MEFLLLTVSCLGLNKKLEIMLKGKKKKMFEERKQASEPNSEKAEIWEIWKQEFKTTMIINANGSNGKK